MWPVIARGLLRANGSDRILYCDHLEDDGGAMPAGACALGLENIVSKRRDSLVRGSQSARSVFSFENAVHDINHCLVPLRRSRTCRRIGVGRGDIGQ